MMETKTDGPWVERGNPTKVGVHEHLTPGHYAMWDGRRWMVGASTVDEAAESTTPSKIGGGPWRALPEQEAGR